MSKAYWRKLLGFVNSSGAEVLVVDEKFYLAAYPDVVASGISAHDHFHNYGWKEGRNPASCFHTLYYAKKNMPGGQLSMNPLLHYAQLGKKTATAPKTPAEWLEIQKKEIAYLFDETFYKRQYGPMLSWLEPIDHYLESGWKQGFNPREDFDTQQYVALNSFLTNSDINPFYHFIVTAENSRTQAASSTQMGGDQESVAREAERMELITAIAPHFDARFYCDENPDIARAKVNPVSHYVDYGWKEGRNPTAYFWTNYYLSSHPEVKLAGVNPFHHYLRHGRQNGLKPNPMGVERWSRPVAPTDEQWAKLAPMTDQEHLNVSVIVPVYKGYDDSLAAIYSALCNPQKCKFDLIVVNDNSPESNLTEKLRALAQKGLFVYVENPENLGFVKTVNKALQMRPHNDVVLLNADTLVYGDWLDRLLQHAKNDSRVATVTPFSNNASICSYPDTNRANFLALECTLEQLDEYASVSNKGRSTRVPTGVGFCFYMRRSVIDEIGDFDLVFGRGYGEENDFCMRALKAGYKNLFAHDVFVYHSGQVSFNEFRVEEYEPGQLALARKHPDYQSQVSAFIHADSALDARMRLDLYRLARHIGPRSAVLITIESSGGIPTHVERLAERLEESGMTTALLYVKNDTATIRLFDQGKNIYLPSLSPVNIKANVNLIAEFLDWLNPEIVHVHSFAIVNWTSANLLMKMLCDRSGPFFVTLHDYDSICHRHHMVDREARYCDVMTLADCRICVRNDNAAVGVVDPAERKEAYRSFLKHAHQVFVPSEDTQKRLSHHFPGLSFVVREHEESFTDVAFLSPHAGRSTIRVVTIGAIGAHKGRDVLYSLALDAKLRSLPIEYYIVGYSSSEEKMREVNVVETGRYSTVAQCISMIEKLEPDFALFPSIWPETYCYSLSIAFALGLPPLVFDIGAQADRVKYEDFGVVFDYALIRNPVALNDAILKLNVSNEWAKRHACTFRSYSNFLESYYGLNPGSSRENLLSNSEVVRQ